MKANKTVLDERQSGLVARIDEQMNTHQATLDAERKELEVAMERVQEIRARIRPINDKMRPLAELKAGIANRISRARYFPQFATRNHGEEKDDEYYTFVESQL